MRSKPIKIATFNLINDRNKPARGSLYIENRQSNFFKYEPLDRKVGQRLTTIEDRHPNNILHI